MTVEIERTFRVLNSEGWRYEVAEVEGGVEIRYFDPYESDHTPTSKVFMCAEDMPAIAACLIDMLEVDE